MSLAAKNVHADIGEFQRAYLYCVFLEDVPTPVKSAFPEWSSFRGKVNLYNTKAVFSNRKTEAITIKWSGEFFDIPGVDGSTRNQVFEFFDDEDMWVYDFFRACKDLTGNEDNQAGVRGIDSKFNIGIAKVSVDKETITQYRRLVGCRVYEVNPGEASKDGTDVSKVQVEIRWDRNEEDTSMRGKTI